MPTEQLPDTNDGTPSTTAASAEAARTSLVVQKVRILIALNQLSEVDRGIVDAAASFLESPTDDIAQINQHASNVSQVYAEALMTGDDLTEVDEMHAQLLRLKCDCHIRHNQPALALDAAKILAKGYQDPQYLQMIEEQ